MLFVKCIQALLTSLILLFAITPQNFTSADPHAKGEPEALPIPSSLPEAAPIPAPVAVPDPLAAPIPLPVADIEAEIQVQPRQVYQFSGAIYIYGNGGTYSQGGSYSSATPAQCPSSAPISCTNIGEPDWCCPSGNTCGWASNQVVGCCPSGETCSGTVGGYNQGGPTTTTYYPAATTTYYSNPGTTVYVGGPTTSYYNPGTATVYNGYCSTVVAHGPDLPTTAAGPCGTVLIVNGAEALLRVGLIGTIGLVLGGLLVTLNMGGWG